MSEKENDKLDRILHKLELQGEDIDLIKRGMYGDPLNGTLGLIKDNVDQEKRILYLEENHRKQKWIIAGVSVTIPFIIHLIKEKFGL